MRYEVPADVPGRGRERHANVRARASETWPRAAARANTVRVNPGPAVHLAGAPLQRGDLPGARSAATELPQINLADALAIALLMAADDDAAYARERVTTAIVDAPGETVSPARGAA
jgi:hypothetical protein